MQLQLISDIHLEFNQQKSTYFITPVCKYLVIAGDLGHPIHSHYKEFLDDVSQQFEKIFLILGNHEYYGRESMNNILIKVQELVKNYNNIILLNNDEYILDDYVILGTTLWSDVSTNPLVKYAINDYKYIYINDPHLTFITPKHVTNLFKENVDWLTNKIQKYKDKKIIVLSHHLPSFQLIAEQYKNNDYNQAYASDLEYLMNDVTCWLFGHTHTYIEKKINGCLCVANPVGYPDENVHYKDKVIVV